MFVKKPYLLPGKKSRELIERMDKHVANANNIGLYGLVFKDARNVTLTDVDGNEYLDFFGGASVVLLGYDHNHLMKKFIKVTKTLHHTCAPYAPNIYQIELAEILAKTHPGNFEKKVMFGLTGSDSVDGAIKASMEYTKKNKIISFKGSYHGSTGLSYYATGFTANAEDVPFSSSFIHLDFPATEEIAGQTLQSIATLVQNGDIAAILIEPMLGDGGIIAAHQSFFPRLQEICRANNVVMIADEIQAGMGRSGKFWHFEHFGFIPDLIVVGKGISNGYSPLSAVVGRRDIIDSLTKGQHVFTYTAHPATCAVSINIIEDIQKNLDVIREKGEFFRAQLKSLEPEFPDVIYSVRGIGLNIGVELRDRKTGTAIAGLIGKRCTEYGVYMGFIGRENEVLRIQPPFIIKHQDILRAVTVIRQVLHEYVTGTIPPATYQSYTKYCLGLGANELKDAVAGNQK